MGVCKSEIGGRGRVRWCKGGRCAIKIKRPGLACASRPRLRTFVKKIDSATLLARQVCSLWKNEEGGVKWDHGDVWEVHHFA